MMIKQVICLVSLRHQLPILKIQIKYNTNLISQVYGTLIIGDISLSSLLLVGKKPSLQVTNRSEISFQCET